MEKRSVKKREWWRRRRVRGGRGGCEGGRRVWEMGVWMCGSKRECDRVGGGVCV